MGANNSPDALGLAGDDELLVSVLRTQIPAIPPIGSLRSVVWTDAASGGGGALRVRHDSDRQWDHELRVIVLDDRTIAFWLTNDGHRLGWMRGALA